MNVVLDTNVIVSALISPNGHPAQILRLIEENEELGLYYSQGILAEYKDVLSRSRLNINKNKRRRFLILIEDTGLLIVPTVSTMTLPDETDRVFYDTAKEAGATLVTGNIKHYPEEDFIMTPNQFIEGITV